MKKLRRILGAALTLWLVFALVGSTLGALLPVQLNMDNKNTLGKTSFYGGPGPGPDRALVVEDITDALNLPLEMVNSAQKTIDLTTHSVKNSPLTQAFLSALIRAADRGVQVRFLVDGKTIHLNGGKGLLNTLASHPNIALKVYNPAKLLKPWAWHMLLHDKFLMADGGYLLLGGRNIDQRHFAPNGYEKAITYDRDVFVHKTDFNSPVPSALDQTAHYFQSLWNEESLKEIKKSSLEDERANLEKIHQTQKTFEAENRRFYQKKLEDDTAQTVETKKITLIHNPTGPSKKEPWVAWQLEALAQRAKKRVWIQTPYATGNQNLLHTLETLNQTKEVTLITNALPSTPNLLAFSNYLGHRQRFLNTQTALYEYQSTNSHHGKSLLMDDDLALIGSFNMDERSGYLSTEIMLVIHSQPLAGQLEEAMGQMISSSLQVGQNNRYLKEEQALEVPWPKALLAKILYWVMRPVQGLL